MINGKTYYEILGVLPDAEDIVIRAAYRSLSQKYHPDKWTGDKKFSTERMSNINRSYEILSDSSKRAKYDDELGSSKNGAAFDAETDKEDEFQDFYSQSEKDWKLAIEYFPDIDGLFVSLKKINYGLAFAFRQTLIEKKAFANALDIHKTLKQNFLKRYFGTNIRIQSFAETLILDNQKKAALELNQTVKLLGETVNSNILIKKISEKFLLKKSHWHEPEVMKVKIMVLTQYQSDLKHFNSIDTAIAVIDYLGGSVKIAVKDYLGGSVKSGEIFTKKFVVTLDGSMFEFHRAELIDFALMAIKNKLHQYQ